jgi:hypothetical protein
VLFRSVADAAAGPSGIAGSTSGAISSSAAAIAAATSSSAATSAAASSSSAAASPISAAAPYTVVLADEVLTPDSSRFWPAESYAPGKSQPSFDKQFVRDWLTANWDQRVHPAPPRLPQEIIGATSAKYIQAYESITGEKFISLGSG